MIIPIAQSIVARARPHQRFWPMVGLILLAAFALLATLGPSRVSAQPHGAYLGTTLKCEQCHDVHTSAGDALLQAPTEKTLCYSCHDGTGSVYDARAEFGESVSGTSTFPSVHPAPDGRLACHDCHTPHRGPEEGNPMSLAAGPSRVATGSVVCGGCHGSGSVLPGGDHLTPLQSTPHETAIATPSSGSGVRCLACHQPHASANARLVRERLADPWGVTRTVDTSRSLNPLCLTCHATAMQTFPGATVSGATAHGSVLVSTRASTTYPASGASPTDCANCHEPHGRPGEPDYTRASGEQLCRGCHDAVGTTKPAGYSYRGSLAFGSSAHTSITSTLAIGNLYSDSDGFIAWESTRSQTPTSPGIPIERARLDAMRTVNGQMAVTSLATSTGEFDYQMYRFKMPAGTGSLGSIALNWVGYGEALAGYPLTLSVWNTTLAGGDGGWETVNSGVYGTTTTLTVGVTPAPHVTPDGYVYVLASNKHARKTDITWGPYATEATTSTAKIVWSTRGPSSSWVDVGSYPGPYTGTYGSATATMTHSVVVPLPDAGVYHFRVTSTDVEGTTATSTDQVFGSPAPTITPVTGGPNRTNITFTWGLSEFVRAPYTYQLSLQDSAGNITDLPWQSATSLPLTLPFDTWTWWVTAKDASGTPTARSASNTFTTYYYDPSCPILYTWDGSRWNFITDVMGFGTLGIKQGTGYRYPPPVEDSRIDPQALVADGGEYRIKFVNEKPEIEFIDKVNLRAVDHPEGTKVYLNDYTRSSSTTVTNDIRIFTTRDERPVQASYSNVPLYTGPAVTDEDITAEVSGIDGSYAPSGFFDDNRYTFDLGDLRDAEEIKLVVNGWTQYATPDERAAWEQSGVPSAKRMLEVQDADGNWVTVDAKLPFIPGYTKTVVYDLTGKFPAGVTDYKVRMRGFYRTWFDSVKLDTSRTELVTVTELAPKSAELGFRGISRYEQSPFPRYFYDDVIDSSPPTHEGAFTRFGDVLPLMREPDDMYAVMDSGDELSLTFDAPPAEPGRERTVLIHTDGYFQELTGKVDPMPFHAMSNYPYAPPEAYPDDAAHRAYLDEYQTRMYTAGGAPQPLAVPAEQSPGLLRVVAQAILSVWEGVTGGGEVAPAEAPKPRSIHTDAVFLQVGYAKPVQAGASCTACHAVHGQSQPDGSPYPALLGARETQTCTGDGNGSCHSSAANSADGVNVYARVTGANASTRHDLTAEAQASSGSRIACSDCHNPHVETARERFADPDSISETMASASNDYLGPDGDVFVLLGAEHDALAPVMTNIRVDNTTPTIPALLWDTNEPGTSWLDIGETASYELGSFGATLPLVSAHTVASRELTPGVEYHYRLRSADALGNERLTGDATLTVAYPPPAPVIETTPPNQYGYLPISVTTTWTAVSVPDADPVQYLAELWDTGGGGLRYTSGWSSSTAWTLNVSYAGNLMVRVRARDAVHPQAVSAYSNQVVFNISVPSGTCPYLFTNDGSKLAFECDLYGTGKLGMKSKGVYLTPQPDDHLLLRSVPAPIDGAYDLRLVEERLEVDYLDELKLYAVDTIAGRDVVTEMPTLGEAPLPGLPDVLHTVALDIHGAPSAVHVNTGADVTAKLDRTDGDYLVLNDDRNVGFDYQTVELDLTDTAAAPQTKIIIEGRTMFPNSPAGTARSSTFSKRTKLDVQEADGTWRSVPATEFALPKPMEFEKPYAVDLTSLLEGTARKVRLTFLFKTYLDSINVDTTLDEPVRLTEAPLLSADLRSHGFDPVDDPESELYEYVYGQPTPAGQYFPGNYTRFGEVAPLLSRTDDKFVVYGGGDELALRFAQALPPMPGFERRWLVSTHGYYKDVKTDLPKTVDPLPFAAMSGYPYPAGESYPADAEHTAYLAEWNTRVEPSPTGPQDTQAIELPDGGTRQVAQPQDAYSLDSDKLTLATNGLGSGAHTYGPTEGWESQSTSTTPPTPSSPGSAVAGTLLARLNGADGLYWRTDLTGANDRRWNWQVVRFSVPGAELPTVSEVRAAWTGHGEPTASYRTQISIWNHRTQAWEATLALSGAGSDVSMGRSGSAVPNAQCFRCHDGAPPAGVTVPPAVLNIATGWSTSYHGPSVSPGGTGGGLIPEYVRGQAPNVACATCHDPHGSSNIYHFPTTVKDRTGISVANGTQMGELCAACHTGNAGDWHAAKCGGCHPDDDGTHVPSAFWWTRDCSTCHGHNRTFSHPCGGHCHVGSWKTL